MEIVNIGKAPKAYLLSTLIALFLFTRPNINSLYSKIISDFRYYRHGLGKNVFRMLFIVENYYCLQYRFYLITRENNVQMIIFGKYSKTT